MTIDTLIPTEGIHELLGGIANNTPTRMARIVLDIHPGRGTRLMLTPGETLALLISRALVECEPGGQGANSFTKARDMVREVGEAYDRGERPAYLVIHDGTHETFDDDERAVTAALTSTGASRIVRLAPMYEAIQAKAEEAHTT